MSKSYLKKYWQRPQVKEKNRIRLSNKFLCDESFKVQNQLYKNLNRYLRIIRDDPNYEYKAKKLEGIVGCTVNELLAHLINSNPPVSYKFYTNYGHKVPFAERIEVDHIKPVNQFDLTKPKQLKKCWHYTNLRLVKASDNRNYRKQA